MRGRVDGLAGVRESDIFDLGDMTVLRLMRGPSRKCLAPPCQVLLRACDAFTFLTDGCHFDRPHSFVLKIAGCSLRGLKFPAPLKMAPRRAIRDQV